MASGAEPSSSAGVTQAMMEMRLSERLQREAEDEAYFDAVPRVISDTEPAADASLSGKGKGKGRVGDEGLEVGFVDGSEIEGHFVDRRESEGPDLDAPEHREVEPGIHMWRSARERSPLTISNNPFIYCVDFDESCYVDDVTFFGSILINVSFKGCFFSNVQFTRVFLQDMEFVNCDFSDFNWAFGSASNETWTDRHFNSMTLAEKEIPYQIVDPKWLEDLMRGQTGWATWVETHGDGSQPTTNRERSLPDANASGTADPQARSSTSVSESNRSQWIDGDYDNYNGSLDRATRERIMADWHAYAAEQEEERYEEQDQQAIAESLKDCAVLTEEVDSFDSDGNSEARQQGGPSSNRAMGTTGAAEDDGDDEDGPVYSPACRL